MSRLADALKQSRDPRAGAASVDGPVPDPVVIARDHSVVSPPWTFADPSEAPATHPSVPEPAGEDLSAVEVYAVPRRRWWPLLAAGLLLAVALGAAWVVVQPEAAGAVSEFQVRRGSLRQIVAARGRVEPGTEIGVTAKMIGRIEAVHVREGEQVAPGQLVAEMEDEDLVAQLAHARAVLSEARARLAEVLAGARPQERAAARARVDEARSVADEAAAALGRQRALAESGLIARSALDEAERRSRVASAQLRAAEQEAELVDAGARAEVLAATRAQVARAEADVQHAEALLANTRVLAPVGGRVLRIFMHPGEVLVMQQPQPIMLLGEGTRMFVTAEVDETDSGAVQIGQRALVRSEAYPDRTFTGQVVAVAPVVGRKLLRSDDPAELVDTRVIETRIELPADARPAVGLTANVEILVVDEPDALVVPASAVRWQGEVAQVEVRSNGGSEPRAITTGVRDDEFLEVREGLREGEIVIVRP
jgi:HlyD family secretion protein